jgi:hypothetical protein
MSIEDGARCWFDPAIRTACSHHSFDPSPQTDSPHSRLRRPVASLRLRRVHARAPELDRQHRQLRFLHVRSTPQTSAALELFAAFAHAASCPSWTRCKPPSNAPSCRNRAVMSLVLHRSRVPGAAAMLLIVPFPQGVLLRQHSAGGSPAVGEARALSVPAEVARTSGLWGDLCSCFRSSDLRRCLSCIFSVQGVWDRQEPSQRGDGFLQKASATIFGAGSGRPFLSQFKPPRNAVSGQVSDTVAS